MQTQEHEPKTARQHSAATVEAELQRQPHILMKLAERRRGGRGRPPGPVVPQRVGELSEWELQPGKETFGRACTTPEVCAGRFLMSEPAGRRGFYLSPFSAFAALWCLQFRAARPRRP